MITETKIEELSSLSGYGDWFEVFKYSDGGKSAPEATPGIEGVSLDPFGAGDVAEVLGSVEGENDESDWIMVGRLKDGRFFKVKAGCDYTGWD